MIILAVDTATESCSVAISKDKDMIGEIFIRRRQTHSRHLISMIDALIRQSGLTRQEIDAFAVTRGPGSFTGLRIGISTVKGLCLASGKQLVGVSALQCLAAPFVHFPHQICALIDARKGEVYGARYCFVHGKLQEKSPEMGWTPPQIVEGLETPCLFVGNGARLYRGTILDNAPEFALFPAEDAHYVRAGTVAALAAEQFQQKGGDLLAAFVPQYIRKSDAELGFGKKS